MKADDISVGQWVAVIGCPAAPDELQLDYGGRPLKVLAVSLPFVAVQHGQEVGVIDTRFWELGRVSEEYANAVLGTVPPPEPEKPDGEACPQCGNRLCQASVRGAWRMYCRGCKYEGAVVA